ncbi:MAG: hypothetical protein ACYDDU_14745 [Dermatophilaceae bacterium]
MCATSPRTRVRPDPLDLAGIDDMLSPDEKAVRAAGTSLALPPRWPCTSDVARTAWVWAPKTSIGKPNNVTKALEICRPARTCRGRQRTIRPGREGPGPGPEARYPVIHTG